MDYYCISRFLKVLQVASVCRIGANSCDMTKVYHGELRERVVQGTGVGVALARRGAARCGVGTWMGGWARGYSGPVAD